MHFIKKGNTPECFIKAKELFDETTPWNEFLNPCKFETKQHILTTEQYGLCVYCERELSLNSARIEHIRPRKRYPEDCFNYFNLAVSCEGKEYCVPETQAHRDYDIDSCDHYKNHNYDEKLFLDPMIIENISDYFSYDFNDGSMKSSSLDDNKADYMIRLLNLDNPSLKNERLKAKTAFLNTMKGLPKEKWKLSINYLINRSDVAFISFLRSYYLIFQ